MCRRVLSSLRGPMGGALRRITKEQEELRQVVEDFGRRELVPIAERVDREDQFPMELWSKMGELGILGVTVPGELGGLGLGYTEQCLVIEELSRFSGSIALSYGAHANLHVNQLARNGSRAQHERFMDPLLSGEYIGALAMSEPEAGSDVLSMKCKAEKKGDVWVLNGTKMWITNGPIADLIIVYAKTGPSSKEVTAFIVEKTMPGFSIAQKLDKLGMRGSPTGELVFENVEVPEENVLGGVGNGVKVLMSGLDLERLVLAAGPVGIMQACMDIVLPYVGTRKQFGEPIGTFQLMQGKIADIYTTLAACRAYLYNTAAAADEGNVSRADCAGVILYCAEAGTQVALQAIQALGGNGYINEYPTGRLLRDAKLYEIGAGTSEIRRMLIGRELFKSEHI